MSFFSPPGGSLTPLHSAPGSANPVRVIIVDDSLVIRGFIKRALEADPSFKVVATANNGQSAVESLKNNPADVIILDIEMPIMDGLTAIPLLKEVDPAAQIIMASTLTQRNADISIRAMTLGATDYLPKPSAEQMAVPNEFNRELKEKVKTLGAIALRKGVRLTVARDAAVKAPIAPAATGEKKKYTLRPMPSTKPAAIAIGSSTGGPQALFEVIRGMGAGLSQPILITQHMPPSFTAILADHIAKQCQVSCAEAKEGELLKPGHFYIAPGDFHMLLTKKNGGVAITLNKDPLENYCRPAVDPMLRSMAEIYGAGLFVVILTGMGQDGTKGGEAVIAAGGAMIAQDEATSVVWGMPGAATMAGLCSAVLPLNEIGGTVQRIATGGRGGGA